MAGGRDRRRLERRRRPGYRFLERRTGFDRRDGAGLLRRRLRSLRERPARFALLLAALNLLNLADYGCTLVALDSGVAEANPFMAALFEQGPRHAGLTKIALAALVSGALWQLRRFRKAAVAALSLCLGLLLVGGYHLFGLLFCR